MFIKMFVLEILKFEINAEESCSQATSDTRSKDDNNMNCFVTPVPKSQIRWVFLEFFYENLFLVGIFCRFIPDPAFKPSIPNWLQLVMKSKSLSER